MIFTSGTQTLQGRTVNHDRLAYKVSSIDMGEFRTDGSYVGYRNVYDPRPEYTVFDNPLLSVVRTCPGISPRKWLDTPLMRDELPMARYTPGQIDHARRVLLRLSALAS